MYKDGIIYITEDSLKLPEGVEEDYRWVWKYAGIQAHTLVLKTYIDTQDFEYLQSRLRWSTKQDGYR